MIANPDKFQSIIISKDKINNSNIEVKVGDKVINCQENVKLLGLTIDHNLNFDKHVSNLYKSASAQLNAIFRLKNLLSFEAKQILINSFVLCKL